MVVVTVVGVMVVFTHTVVVGLAPDFVDGEEVMVGERW
jgi:hypothetical protein